MNHDYLSMLAIRSRKPLKEKLLETFQAEYFGDFRHWYYRFFYHLVAKTRPAIALEIGIHHGHGVLHMAYGYPGTIAVGIDWQADYYAAENYDKYNPGNCIMLNLDSTTDKARSSIEELVDIYGPIGIVFQDSSHHYLPSRREFEIYSQFLATGAIWCCDDVTPSFHDPQRDPPGKGMVEYFNELPGDKRLYDKLHHGSVIGITIL